MSSETLTPAPTAASALSAPSSRVLAFIDSGYWAMYPPAYESMRSLVIAWSHDLSPSRAEKDAAIAQAIASRQQTYQAPPAIAVINMFGLISPRSTMISDYSGGCALDSWCHKYQQIMMDSNIGGVIVNADTPGGNVYQVPEAAELIYSLRSLKPNVCVVTGMGASAGFFLATQFSELVCCPSSEVGSIGVLMQHIEYSKMAEMEGVKATYITSPRDGNKGEGNPFTPLSGDSKEHYNSRTDEYYDMFLNALVRGRGVTGKSAKTQVDQEWGRGRMVGAARALELGMVDRIGTLQSEIERMAKGLKQGNAGGSAKGLGSRSAETVTRLRLA